jgi:DNA-binding transcriptional LysR family regulator
VLRLGFVGALLGQDLLDLFQRFRAEHAGVQLSLFDLPPAELLDQVAREELDGAFLGVAPAQLPEGLAAHAWKREPLLAWYAREDPMGREKRKTVAWEELSTGSMVTLGVGLAPTFRALIDRLFLERGLRPPVVQEANAISALLSLVAAGCGFALLPPSAVAPIADRVIGFKPTRPTIELEEVLITRREPGPLTVSLLEQLRAGTEEAEVRR